MTAAFEAAAAGIKEDFYIEFAVESISYSSQLNCDPSCSASNDSESCDSTCGNVPSCSTMHHRSAVRLLNLLQSETKYVCRFVGYSVCKYENGDHSAEPRGVALLTTHKDIIVSLYKASDEEHTTQHELSHLLGAPDESCSANEYCVMIYGKSFKNMWCSSCKYAMREYIQGELT